VIKILFLCSLCETSSSISLSFSFCDQSSVQQKKTLVVHRYSILLQCRLLVESLPSPYFHANSHILATWGHHQVSIYIYIYICVCVCVCDLHKLLYYSTADHLCSLVIWFPGYRSNGSGFDSRRHQIFWKVVGLERGPLSLIEYNWATWKK
jgi:hypothetical protein